MKYRINAYFAVLLVTIAGSFATLIIVHVAWDANTFIFVSGGSYASLQRSLLKP